VPSRKVASRDEEHAEVAVNAEQARKRRLWLEVSQEAMAKRIGVGRRTLARWEACQQEPRADELQRWARELGWTAEQLLGDSEPAEAVGQ
jgi:transcriptional regulator with XRE-family HTH domain